MKAQARAHRVSVLPYSSSRRILDTIDGTGLTLTRREYYNLKKGQVLDGRDEKTIEGLLFALDDAGFHHRYRVQEELDETGKVISRKLIQIWFTHPKLLQESARFVAGAVYVVDATFNTNKVKMPIIVAVGVLNNGKTFPIAFSYCRAEDHESYSFFWASLKKHWPPGTVQPVIIISDQAGAILSSIDEQFPGVQHQICEWHAAEAIFAKFRQHYTNIEIQGGRNKEGDNVEGLRGFTWAYIQSATVEDLEINRQALLDRLKAPVKLYIEQTWRPKEHRVIRCYTSRLFNLGCRSSQRGESYYVVVKQMTNGQLSLENSATLLARTMTKLIEDIETQRDDDRKAYSRQA